MKKGFIFQILLGSAVLFFSCNSGTSDLTREEYAAWLKKGNEISALAQSVLLANVGNAIQKGGPEYAVEFCNLNAVSIVDSLNVVNNCEITRVSDKNRNSENFLKSETDKLIWQVLNKRNPEENQDTLIVVSKQIVYYKSIRTGMPACLKCHGIPGQDISVSTLEKINKLYPKDLATGYNLNDFRGLWRISFNDLD